MADTNRQYLLKIFSGLHAGAEVPLADGEYRIGVSDECDFILEDGTAGNLALRIGLDNGRMTVIEPTGLCYLDGAPISAEGLDFDAYQVITLGATHFALGPADEKWPEFSPPQIKPPEAASSAQSPPGEDETNVSGQAPAIAGATDDLDATGVSEAGGTTAGDKKNPGLDSAPDSAGFAQDKAHFGKRLVAAMGKKNGICAAAVIIVFMLMLLFFLKSQPPPQQDPLAQARKNVDNLLEKYKVVGRSVITDADGRLAISGFVELASDKKELSRQLEKIAFPKTVKLVAIDESLKTFETVLQNYRLRLKVTHEADGEFALNGFVRDSDLLRAILARLHQDLPMIRRIKSRVHTHEDVVPAVFEELEKSGGISGRIELQAHADHIRVEGNFFPSDREIWVNARARIENRFGKDIHFKEAFIVKPEPAFAATAAASGKQNLLDGLVGLKKQIAGVVLLPRRYLLTSDGKKCFEGGMLAGGYLVKSIRPDRIELTKSGNSISMPLLP
jgi:type III secretion protein D